MKYKNTLLLFISIVLFLYAGFISIFPAMLTAFFNVPEFEKQMYNATNLVTKIGSVDFKVKPNLNMVITLKNWSSKYADEQDFFTAGTIMVTTNPLSIFTKNFKIKNLYLKHVKLVDQILNTGENKIAYLLSAFNSENFGVNKITILPGPVKIQKFKLININSDSYNEVFKQEVDYSVNDIRNLLSNFYFSHIVIK